MAVLFLFFLIIVAILAAVLATNQSESAKEIKTILKKIFLNLKDLFSSLKELVTFVVELVNAETDDSVDEASTEKEDGVAKVEKVEANQSIDSSATLKEEEPKSVVNEIKASMDPAPVDTTTQEIEKVDEPNKIGDGKDTIVMFQEESSTIKNSSEKKDIEI